MTLSNIEPRTPEAPSGKVALHPRLLTPDDPRFADWLVARQQLMDSKGWKSSGGELDSYDANPETRQIVMYDDTDSLVFGMRLTPVESYDETLSWDMVRYSSIHQQAREADLLEPGRRVWDLTRLASGPEVPYRLRLLAIPRLFGEGLRQCAASGDANPVWVFALDEVMATWLDRQGVEFSTLGVDTIAGDSGESTFGFIEPARLAELAERPEDGTKASNFAHRAMEGDS